MARSRTTGRPRRLACGGATRHTPLAEAHRLSLGQLARRKLRVAAAARGSVLSDRLRRLARAIGFVRRLRLGGPDTPDRTGGRQRGGRPPDSGLRRSQRRRSVRRLRLNESTPMLDDHLRVAWRRDDKSLALRRCWMNCSPSRTRRRSEVKRSHNSVVILGCNVLIARLDSRCRRLLAIAHTVWSQPASISSG